jgi:alkaline phosphatase
MIGMGPDGSSPESVVEAAESAGMATGLVVTTRITHATPAAFSAHVPERGMESEIASQQIASNIDLLVGGGRQFFLPGSAGGSREDGRDLLAEAAAAGYVVLDAYADLDTLSSLPVLALLSPDHMPYEVDRPDDFPSLSVMTERAIELLSDDQDGFFLMVEGSRIDHAGHANDISGHLHDILAYDAAVSTALRFARNDGQTLVVSVSDHETGGLTIGRSVGTSSAYEWQPEVADHITASHHVILEAVRNDGRPTREILEAYTGITDFTDEEIAGVMTEGWGANSALAEMISRRILIGWTTTGHTAVDVGLFAFGPGSDRLKGHVENSRLGLTLLDLVKSRNMDR